MRGDRNTHPLLLTPYSLDLMFVSDDSALVGDGNGDFGGIVEDNTLTTKAAFKARVDSAVNKIFFFVRYFFQKIFALLYVNMASGAGTHSATIVIEVNVEFLCQFQNRFVLKITRDSFRRYAGIFK